jgi:hypothetical protein
METETGVSFEEILPPTNTTTQFSYWLKIKRKNWGFSKSIKTTVNVNKQLNIQQKNNNNMESIHEIRDGKQDENS